MADINGGNYAKEFVDIPSDVAAIGEYGGRKKVMFDTYTGATPGADDVYFGRIPAGARILQFTTIGGGTAPTFSTKAVSTGATAALAVGYPPGLAWSCCLFGH